MLFNQKSNQGDAKWRGTIERALASWDSVVEWSDYIVFLSRLEKAIKSKSTTGGSEMPLAWQVSEALARCLAPNLPAGVHQTTLHVYDALFSSIPQDQLNAQINIWLPGLLPVVSYAAFNVKPLVVTLLEKYVLKVPNLRELCRPLLLATFPSIEDTASECYNEILNLIQTLRENLGDEVLMWQCISICIITCHESRLGALQYLGQFFPSLETIDDSNRAIVSPEPGIFLRAVSSGLTDSNIFVQRGFLDILAKNLPAHSSILQKTTSKDFENLLYSACLTILRKDMSLNRRLWAWLLGPDPELTESKVPRVDYFRNNCAEPLQRVLNQKIKTHLDQVCLLVHGLMDRWEIATVVVPRLLTRIIKAAKNNRECLQAASQLFDGVESKLIWKCIIDLIEAKDYDTVAFILSQFNINEEEMVSVHIPLTLLAAVELKAPEPLQETLIKLVQTSVLASVSTFENKPAKAYPQIKEFYSQEWDEETPLPPFSANEITQMVAQKLLKSSLPLFAEFINKLPSFSAKIPELVSQMLLSKPDATLFGCVSTTMDQSQISQWVHSAIKHYFDSLTLDQALQVENVRDLWLCHQFAGGLIVPSALSQCFAQCTDPLKLCRAFAAVWIHSVDHANYAELLAKPTLLFLDLLANDKTKQLAVLFIKNGVLITNSTDKLLKILFGYIKTRDSARLEYYLTTLNRLVFGLGLVEIKKAFLSNHFKTFLDMFSEMPKHDGCYTVGISIIQSSLLDVDKLNVSAIISVLETLVMESQGHNSSLISFIDTVLPHLAFDKRVTFADEITLEYQLFHILNQSFETFETEPQMAALSAYLSTFLEVFQESVPLVVYPITVSLVNRLNELQGSLDKNSELIMQLMWCLDKLLYTNFQYLYDAKGGHFSSYQDVVSSPETATASKILGNVISGVFSVESPSERSAIQSGRVFLYEAIEMTVARCCSYWETLEKIRSNTEGYSTLLYSMGRLKTRLRKLTAMLYKYQPIDTIKLCVKYSTSIKSAVKFVHMFEGSRYKNTVQVFLDSILGSTDDIAQESMFAFVKQYIRTLENDVLEDIWNLIMSFCVDINTKHGQYQSALVDILELLVIISKKLDASSFGQNKRLRKDFSEQFIRIFGYALELERLEPFVEIGASLGFIQDADRQNALLTKLGMSCFSLFKGETWHEVPTVASEVFAVVVVNSTSPRAWKQVFTDLFFDSRFFTLSLEHARNFEGVVERWVQTDKERTAEFLGRIATYGSNSVFGWSSSSALVDDNMKRLAFMSLCCGEQVGLNITKVINQLTTIWGNKQSIPQACVLLRALALEMGQPQFYGFIAFKLQSLFCGLHEGNLKEDLDAVSTRIIVEGAKLLDFVLTLESNEFQMYEWLFICDNTDAIYPRQRPEERAGDLLGKLASERETQLLATGQVDTQISAVRHPLLMPNASFADVMTFLNQASISLYEEMYSLARVDKDLLAKGVLRDLFSR